MFSCNFGPGNTRSRDPKAMVASKCSQATTKSSRRPPPGGSFSVWFALIHMCPSVSAEVVEKYSRYLKARTRRGASLPRTRRLTVRQRSYISCLRIRVIIMLPPPIVKNIAIGFGKREIPCGKPPRFYMSWCHLSSHNLKTLRRTV